MEEHREEIDWDVSPSETDIKTVCEGNEKISVRVSREEFPEKKEEEQKLWVKRVRRITINLWGTRVCGLRWTFGRARSFGPNCWSRTADKFGCGWIVGNGPSAIIEFLRLHYFNYKEKSFIFILFQSIRSESSFHYYKNFRKNKFLMNKLKIRWFFFM